MTTDLHQQNPNTTVGGATGDHIVLQSRDVYAGPTTAKERNALRATLIPFACWRLTDLRFQFGLSFVLPDTEVELRALDNLIAKHSVGHLTPPLSVFGHADPVGDDAANKVLSGRRAGAIYGLLTRDTAMWEDLFTKPHGSDRWGDTEVDLMLARVQRDEGPSDIDRKSRIKSFQNDHGLTTDGIVGPNTRRSLFKAYMDALAGSLVVDRSEFLGKGQDNGGKADYQGCSEFNPLFLFSNNETKTFKQASDKSDRNTANAPNRRVMIFLFRPGTTVNPKHWPCPRAGEGIDGCKKRFWSDGESRRTRQEPDTRREYSLTHDTFGCRFYDRLSNRSPCEQLINWWTVVYVDDHWWRKGVLKIPYVQQEYRFRSGIRSQFGDKIPNDVCEQLRQAFLNQSFPAPKYDFRADLDRDVSGFYKDGTISLSSRLILRARQDPYARWQLFLVMIEEFGHHIDHLLRTHFSDLGGDAKGDEGTRFASDFVHFNHLIDTDFDYATFTFESANQGSTTKQQDLYAIQTSTVDREARAKELLFVEDALSDRGTVKLKNGESVEVEFYKIRGGGAVHEEITIIAAKKAKMLKFYEPHLDEGCAWPDVPCPKDGEKPETCYYNTWRTYKKKGTLANRSHYGDLQFWHAMAPNNKMTNGDVVEKIIKQHKAWYERAVAKNNPFHVGKILHTVQDSYSTSHVKREKFRNPVKDNLNPYWLLGRVIQFQDYGDQAEKKHSHADERVPLVITLQTGVTEAIDRSATILNLFRERKPWTDLETFLRKQVFAFVPGREKVKAGGSEPDYKK